MRILTVVWNLAKDLWLVHKAIWLSDPTKATRIDFKNRTWHDIEE